MKTLKFEFLFITALLLLSFSEKNDPSRKNLKGKVKSKKSESCQIFNASTDSVKVHSFGITTEKYDEKGYLTEKIIYRPNLMKDSVMTFVYSYDNKGNKIDGLRYNANGELECKYIYKYGLYGIVEERDYDPNSAKYFLKTYEYDKSGNMILEKLYSNSGILTDSVTHKYDKHGNIIETKSSTHHGRIEKMDYDSQGNRIEEDVYDPTGNIETKHQYEFDDKKNSILGKTYNSNGIITHEAISKYTYDTTDNWRVDSVFENGVLTHIATQELEYY